jgi:hypothetical protein
MKRFLWLSWIAFLFLFCAACGDTFRPIIIPNLPTFPDPRAAHTMVALNDNGSISPGSVLVVDVSGDSEVSIRNVGVTPVHAVQQTANQVLVVNHDNTATSINSLSKLVFSGTTINAAPATISLPPNSGPNFVATTESNQAYVLLPNFVPDPVNNPNQVVPSVGVVSTVSNSLTATAPVGKNPMAMAETVDTKKLYVASQGDSSISGFNTIDRSLRNNPLLRTSSPPIWLSARSDSQRVYVLEFNGTLASIDTTSTAGPDTLTESSISAPGATTMVYDGRLNRLYVPGGNSALVVDVSQSALTPSSLLASVPITPVSPATRNAQDPCSTTATATLAAVTAAALPDGSRAYFGAFYEDAAGNICPQVTVINTSNNSVKAIAAVPGFPNFDTLCASTRFRFTLAAGGDSSRVYLASCDSGGVNVIDTSTDTFLVGLPAPAGSRNNNPPQNPIFLIAGP